MMVIKKIALAVILTVCAGLTPVMAESFEVPAELWEHPRSGAQVMASPPVRKCIQQWMEKPASRLIIHHNVREISQLQAAELRYWLVALAVNSDRIELMEDLSSNELMNMEIREPQ